jgi:hypothetical protein
MPIIIPVPDPVPDVDPSVVEELRCALKRYLESKSCPAYLRAAAEQWLAESV